MYTFFPRHVRYVIQIALRIRIEEIRRRRNDSLAQRADDGDEFDGAGCPERMAMHGFGRRYRELVGVRAEYTADGPGFGRIVGWRAGAVRIDVADVFR